MKILHTADWHLGDFKGPKKNNKNLRFIDIVKSIDSLITKAKAEKPDVIIVAGDIFHKSIMWGDNMLRHVSTMSDSLDDLADIAPTFVMIGTANHDNRNAFDMLADLTRAEIISQPCTRMFNHGELTSISFIPPVDRKVFRQNNDETLSFAEENIAITDLLKDIVLGESVEAQKNNPDGNHILVSHYTMVGAKSEQDHIFSTGDIMLPSDAVEASCYDIVCLGHIHKAQRIEGLKKPVFYSGNVSAINFNEEGDSKGFYIHDLNNGAVESIFHEVWTREFLTLKFNEETMAYTDMLDTWLGFESMEYAKDKIVRVKYESSEEVEKHLNKKKIENYLYSKGAFYVQGITPISMAQSTNKETIENKGIIENLIIFLESQAVEKERINTLIELARPIIQKAESTFNIDHVVGTFKPLELTVKNYRAYNDETFDFTKITKAIVQGKNGIGKSSFFMDAILDCLFEEPREGVIDGWIDISDDVKKGIIEFTFSIGDITYKVIRTRLKSGRATLSIQRLTEDGEWFDESTDNMRGTQQKIVNLLGMDYDTFKSCVLIVQDQYGLVLEADKTKRMKIILNILGLDIYEKLEKRFSELRLEKKHEIDKLDEFININSNLPMFISDSEESLTEIEEEIKTLTNNKKTKTLELEKHEKDIKLINDCFISCETYREILEKNSIKREKLLAEGVVLDDKLASIKVEDKLQYTSIIIDLADAQNKVEKRDLIAESIKDVKQSIDDIENQIGKEKGISLTLNVDIKNLRDSLASTANINIPELEKELQEMIAAQSNIDGTTKSLRTLTDKVKTLENEKEVNFAKSESVLRQEESTVAMLEEKTKLLENANCIDIENAHCKFLQNAIEAKESLSNRPDMKENPYVKAYTGSIMRLAEAEKRAADYAENVKDILNDKFDYQHRIDVINSLINKKNVSQGNEKLLESYCNQLDSNDALIFQYNTNLLSLNKKKEELEARFKPFENLGNDVARLENAKAKIAEIEAAEEKIKEIKFEISQNNKSFENLYLSSAENTNFIISLEDELYKELDKTYCEGVTINDILLNYIRVVTAIKESIESIDENLMEQNQDLGSCQANLKALNELHEEFKEKEALRYGISIEKANYFTLQKSFSQDGVPFMIIRSMVEILEMNANEVLSKMTDGKMSTKIVLDKPLRSDNKKEVATIEVYIIDYIKGSKPYLSLSGGEKVRAALAYALSLAQLKASQVGLKSGALFIDEPPFLDAEGVSAYCEVLNVLSLKHEDMTIIAMSHDEDMKSRFDQVIEVYGTDNGSKIRMI